MVGGLICENGGQLIKDKVSVLGPNTGKVKLLLPDGFTTQSTIDEAGAANADGLYASVAGVPPNQLKGAGATFVQDFTNTYHPGRARPVHAVRGRRDAGAAERHRGVRRHPRRHRQASVRCQVHDSVLGNFAIDQNGDTNQGSMTIDVAKGGKLSDLQGAHAAVQPGGDLPLGHEEHGGATQMTTWRASRAASDPGVAPPVLQAGQPRRHVVGRRPVRVWVVRELHQRPRASS